MKNCWLLARVWPFSGRLGFLGALVASLCAMSAPPATGTPLTGKIVDSKSGAALPARVYIRGADGKWHFPASASPGGSAVPYRKQRGKSAEMHTTLSAHPFRVDLAPGRYRITAERGTEYRPNSVEVEVGQEPLEVTIKLTRWVSMAAQGWYSGDTHTHRSPRELPNVMLAEDLNAAFPLVHWVTKAFAAPPPPPNAPSPENIRPVRIDATHAYHPRNTEYEIFTVDGKRHTLGAVFILGHKSIFQQGVPPVRPIAEIARREGALLELDKHNWPWSMALIPVMEVDLFELTNNHLWRVSFHFDKFGVLPPAYMKCEMKNGGMTERGWIDYGFQNYYALLNCGFRLRPTAGTASGVHPVPLGFGRVYVHLPQGFSLDAWLKGLNAGHSFVTTGPMLIVRFNGKPPGHIFRASDLKASRTIRVSGTVLSLHPVSRIEVLQNGHVVASPTAKNLRTPQGAYGSALSTEVEFTTTGWVAVRAYAEVPPRDGDGGTGSRPRFAHSAPVHVEVSGKPLTPRREEVQFLVDRVQSQIDRSRDILPAAALAEYERALRAYRSRMPK